jgi:hypothetical protein
MSYDMDPIVGNWYQHVDKGLDFEVVAVDEENASVEIQYADGTLDEIGLDDWYEIDIEPAEPPEDWTGPLEDADTDEIDDTDSGVEEDDWDEPGSGRHLRGRRIAGDDDLPPEELDGDWDE